ERMSGRQRAVQIGDQVLHLLRKMIRIRVVPAAYRERRHLIAAGSASDTEVDAPRIQRLEHPELLRHLERAAVGKQDTAGPDPDPRGFSGYPRQENLGAGIGKRGNRVMFGQPVAVITEFLGRLHQSYRFVHRPGGRMAADDGRLVENAQFDFSHGNTMNYTEG